MKIQHAFLFLVLLLGVVYNANAHATCSAINAPTCPSPPIPTPTPPTNTIINNTTIINNHNNTTIVNQISELKLLNRLDLQYICKGGSSTQWKLTNIGTNNVTGLSWKTVLDGSTLSGNLNNLNAGDLYVFTVPHEAFSLSIYSSSLPNKILDVENVVHRECGACDRLEENFESSVKMHASTIHYFTNVTALPTSECKKFYCPSPEYQNDSGYMGIPYYIGTTRMYDKRITPVLIMGSEYNLDVFTFKVFLWGSNTQVKLKASEIQNMEFHECVPSTKQPNQLVNAAKGGDIIMIGNIGVERPISKININKPLRIIGEKNTATSVMSKIACINEDLLSISSEQYKPMSGVSIEYLHIEKCKNVVILDIGSDISDVRIISNNIVKLGGSLIKENVKFERVKVEKCGSMFNGWVDSIFITNNNVTIEQSVDRPREKIVDFALHTFKTHIVVSGNLFKTLNTVSGIVVLDFNNLMDGFITGNTFNGFYGSRGVVLLNKNIVSCKITKNLFINNKDSILVNVKNHNNELSAIKNIVISKNVVKAHKIGTLKPSLASVIPVFSVGDRIRNVNGLSHSLIGKVKITKNLMLIDFVASPTCTKKIEYDFIRINLAGHTSLNRHNDNSQCSQSSVGPITIYRNHIKVTYSHAMLEASSTPLPLKYSLVFINVKVKTPRDLHHSSSHTFNNHFLTIGMNRLTNNRDNVYSLKTVGIKLVFSDTIHHGKHKIAYLYRNVMKRLTRGVVLRSNNYATSFNELYAAVVYNEFNECEMNIVTKTPSPQTTEPMQKFLDNVARTFIINNNFYGTAINKTADFKHCFSTHTNSRCLCNNKLECDMSDVCHGCRRRYLPKSMPLLTRLGQLKASLLSYNLCGKDNDCDAVSKQNRTQVVVVITVPVYPNVTIPGTNTTKPCNTSTGNTTVEIPTDHCFDASGCQNDFDEIGVKLAVAFIIMFITTSMLLVGVTIKGFYNNAVAFTNTLRVNGLKPLKI
jgi:hypothetical protein